MAQKKTVAKRVVARAAKAPTKNKASARVLAETTAKFPYTTKPASLRRLLKEMPGKPRPPKFDMNLLKSWGFNDANDHSMLRVLKAVNLTNDKNEPTELYSRFMSLDGGAKALGPEVKRVYEPLFQASHTPYSESNEKLQNLFNIHSGGGDRSLDQQIQTFKALCEYASFEIAVGNKPAVGANLGVVGAGSAGVSGGGASDINGGPIVNINLHIHLPENKSRRDYEDIIEDIGRYIFGRVTKDRRE